MREVHLKQVIAASKITDSHKGIIMDFKQIERGCQAAVTDGGRLNCVCNSTHSRKETAIGIADPVLGCRMSRPFLRTLSSTCNNNNIVLHTHLMFDSVLDHIKNIITCYLSGSRISLKLRIQKSSQAK
jgi:hypothetical protein